MSKHSRSEPQIEGKPLGNPDPAKRGRGGDPAIGQPPKDQGKHSK